MSLNVTVTLKDAEPVDIPITNPDRVRWDITRTKHGWPNFVEAPFLGTTFLAWAAMKRENKYTGPFEQFRDTDAIEVESKDETPDEDEVGDLGVPFN